MSSRCRRMFAVRLSPVAVCRCSGLFALFRHLLSYVVAPIGGGIAEFDPRPPAGGRVDRLAMAAPGGGSYANTFDRGPARTANSAECRLDLPLQAPVHVLCLFGFGAGELRPGRSGVTRKMARNLDKDIQVRVDYLPLSWGMDIYCRPRYPL